MSGCCGCCRPTGGSAERWRDRWSWRGPDRRVAGHECPVVPSPPSDRRCTLRETSSVTGATGDPDHSMTLRVRPLALLFVLLASTALAPAAALASAAPPAPRAETAVA